MVNEGNAADPLIELISAVLAPVVRALYAALLALGIARPLERSEIA